MYQDLFLHMHQTLDQIQQEFPHVDDIDEELSLLEQYLNIKETSRELRLELEKLQKKIKQFEEEQGLADLHLLEEPLEGLPEIQAEEDQGEMLFEIEADDFIIFQKGIGFFDLWMYDEAIMHLEKIITKYPDFNLARLYKAMTYYKKKEYDQAKQELLQLFRFSEDKGLNALAHNLLGMINGYQHNVEQAITHFEQAITLKSKWNEPKFNLSILLYKLNRLHDSIYLLNELHQANPKDWEVMLYLGKAYQKLNQLDKANELYKKTYEVTKQPAVIRQIAKLFESRRDFQQAVHWYKKWLEFEANLEAMLGLAKNVWLTGKKEEAFSLIKKALSLDKHHVEAKLIYAWMLTDANDQKAYMVIDSLKKEVDQSAFLNHAFLIANLARLYYLHDDVENSNRFCTMLFSTNEPHIKALGHMVQGLIDLDQNLPDQSLYHFQQAIHIRPKFPYLEFYLGYSHYLLGNTEQAKESWAKWVDQK